MAMLPDHGDQLCGNLKEHLPCSTVEEEAVLCVSPTARLPISPSPHPPPVALLGSNRPSFIPLQQPQGLSPSPTG